MQFCPARICPAARLRFLEGLEDACVMVWYNATAKETTLYYSSSHENVFRFQALGLFSHLGRSAIE